MAVSVLSGRYELGGVVGRGGMAEVREARDLVLDRRVAVKVLLPALAADPTFIERFSREATAAASLSHPNMVAIYDAGSDGDTRYLVMEYLDGRTLADLLRDHGRLDLGQVLKVGAAVASTLGAVHRAGLVHRDVKPANIMVSPGRGVKLMDLGIALAADVTSLTATATVIGTAAYLSPEQAQGQVADARSDLYSLGCVLYEAATGQRPFEGDSLVAVAMQHVNAHPPAPSRLVDDLPAALDTVLARAMSKDPARRYATADDLARELERLERGLDTAAGPDDASASTRAMAITDPTAVHTGPRVGAAGDERNEPTRRRQPRAAVWVLAALVLAAGVAVATVAAGLFDDGTGARGPGDQTPAPTGDRAEGTETTPATDQPTPTTAATTSTTAPPAADFTVLDDAVAEVGVEADRARDAGEIDQSARDNLVDKASDVAAKARDGDSDALDQVESLREDLQDLRDDGDLTAPPFNRLRRAVDYLEAAIIAVI